MKLRPATPADRPAMTTLQIASWRSAYRDLLSEAYLGEQVVRDLTARWAAPDPEGAFQLVAEEGDRLLGFVAVIPHDGPYVDNLHIDPALRGRGIGARLMRAAAEELVARGESRLWLTVIETNLPAVRFYRAIGGQFDPPTDDEMFGQKIRTYRVSWPDLAVLTDPPPAG